MKTNYKFLLIPLLLLALAMGGAGLISAEASPPAATLTVGNKFNCDYGTVQDAVDNANSGDTILVQNRTFSGVDATVNIFDKSLTIVGGQFNCDGAGLGATVMDADGQADTIFELLSNGNAHSVTLRNFELRNAGGDAAGGGIEINGGYDVTLENVYIHGNSAGVDGGGGIYLFSPENVTLPSSLTLIDSTISSNSVPNDGAGIFCVDAEITMQGSSVIGGVAAGNAAGQLGGGVYMLGCVLTLLDSADIANNQAVFGGGIYASRTSFVNINSNANGLRNNRASIDGGGAYLNFSSVLLVQKGSIERNMAARGAGVAAFNNAFVSLNPLFGCDDGPCVFLRDNATGKGQGNIGGGIYAHNSNVSLTRAEVEDNYAVNGAAIYIETDNDFAGQQQLLSIESTLLTDNVARERSVVAIHQLGNQPLDAEILGTTFAYNHTEFLSGDLLDLDLTGQLNVALTGVLVRGDESGNGIVQVPGISASVTCSVLPTGWNFSNVKNLIGDQDVQFRDIVTGDFRVKPTSPAVDICDLSTGFQDLRGVERAVDMPVDLGNQTISMGAYDAGAYELGGVFGRNQAPCAYSSIADALADAEAGDTIYGLPRSHTAVIGTLTTPVSIASSGSAGCDTNPIPSDLLTFDLFNLNLDTSVVTITQGTSVSMTQVALVDGTSPFGAGGNVKLLDNSSLFLDRSVIRRGSAGTLGGGIYADNSTLWLHDSRVVANRAFGDGAGIYANTSDVWLTGNTVIGGDAISTTNVADGSGGGLFLRLQSTLTISDSSRLVGNEAVLGSGGGVYAFNSPVHIADAVEIAHNIAGEQGGGVATIGAVGVLTMTSGSVYSNTAASGGGLSARGGASIFLTGDTVVEANLATDDNPKGLGGGVFLDQSPSTRLTIRDEVLITGNEARVGGGIYGHNNVIIAIYDSAEVSHNSASSGGGIYMRGDAFTLRGDSSQRPSIHHNVAVSQGGGLNLTNGENFSVRATDVYSNSASLGGGVFSNNNDGLLLQNLFVTGNVANTGGGAYIALDVGTIISADFAAADRNDACDDATLAPKRYCSHFSGNQAAFSAALHIANATVAITHTAITDHLGLGNSNGPLISVWDDSSEVTFDTILAHNNRNLGEVIEVTQGAPEIHLRNSTIYNNDGRPLDLDDASLLQIDRSIIWGNQIGTDIGLMVPMFSGCNITQPIHPGSQAFSSPTDSTSDPQLFSDALADGLIGAGSPALDSCSDGHPLDLRGRPRPINGVGNVTVREFDRGAFEYDPNAPVPTAIGLGVASTEYAQPMVWVLLAMVSLLTVAATHTAYRSGRA